MTVFAGNLHLRQKGGAWKLFRARNGALCSPPLHGRAEEREAGAQQERFHGASWREMGAAAAHAQVAWLEQEEVGEQGCCAAIGSLPKKYELLKENES